MSIDSSLNEKTSIFGLRLWVDIGTGGVAVVVLILFLLLIWLISRKKLKGIRQKLRSIMILMVSYGIKEVKVDQTGNTDPPLVPDHLGPAASGTSGRKDMEKVEQAGYGILTGLDLEEEMANVESRTVMQEESRMEAGRLTWNEEEKFEMAGGLNSPVDNVILEGEKLRLVASTIVHESLTANMKSYSVDSPSSDVPIPTVPEVSHLDWGNWGHWYALQDLEAATDCFSEVNILGKGGYGIVYRGQLPNGTLIAVKKLLNKSGQAEREFRVEVEAIGRVRHKNLVHLLGYCADGHHRMLVYEHVDNGNLDQWLHGSLGENNPIPWDIRMKIMIGTAKGLAYLHEGLEPKVVHRDVKSSNILLDCQWNAKVSDFGLAKLLGSEKSHVTTQVIGTFGYVAPDYASTGLLNEKSDVYGFGVLMMELITGREPVDYGRPAGEVNVVDWLKIMVTSRRYEEVADPKLGVRPSSRALKRALLVALRCVDPDSEKRPKMGHVIHMLEGDDSLFGYSRRSDRDATGARNIIAHRPGTV